MITVEPSVHSRWEVPPVTDHDLVHMGSRFVVPDWIDAPLSFLLGWQTIAMNFHGCGSGQPSPVSLGHKTPRGEKRAMTLTISV
jgi:hypothetical protein